MLNDFLIIISCIAILGLAGCLLVDEKNTPAQLEKGACLIRCSEQWCEPVCRLDE